MALSQEQMRALIAFVNERWSGNAACRQCGQNNWSIDSYVLHPLSPAPTTVTLGAGVLPSAAFVCKNCGNTLFVNLVVAGVVPGKTQ
jgi:hypothetical protein